MRTTKLPTNKMQHRTDSPYLMVFFIIPFLFVAFIALSIFPSFSHAQEFTAKTIGDYGNVTVMEVRGNFDAVTPGGSTVNDVPRREIAKEFFRLHKDQYDFLVIFTNFDFTMPEGDAMAFYLPVRNDTQGIGRELFDDSVLFGSNGRLQGTIDMGNVDGLAIVPLEPGFEETLDILAHETMHRWGAYLKFKDAFGNVSDALLHLDPEKHAAHWSFLLDSEGSTLYGNDWQDNGNGTFTSVGIRKYYSSLDLYLMGFYDKSQVPPMLLIDNPEIPRERLPELGVTITGTPQTITIDNIIAAEGERVPSPAESQMTFKTAFIFITTPGTFEGNEISQFHLQGMENIRSGWMTRFSILTDGQGMMQIAAIPKEEPPTNPGTVLPPIVPRPLPPNIDDGVAWLRNHQQADGSWRDSLQTTLRDTAETLLSLKNFAIAAPNYSSGLQWLSGADSRNRIYLSKKIEALSDAGGDVSAYLTELLSGQNPDGGWGSNKLYRSNPVDTSFAIKALASAGYSGQGVLSKAIEYLKSKQNTDGGWGNEGGGSSTEATTNVLYAFNKYRNDFQVEGQISNGIPWLAARQNPDGGFGASPSTVYETGMAISVLRELDVMQDARNSGLSYLLNLQMEDGSWYESPYQTAAAIRTVFKATIDPDLSIKATDIAFIPPTVNSLPSSVEVRATLWNLGRTAVSQAKVVLYDGDPSLNRKLGEQTLDFPGQASVAVTFPVVITDGNEHRYYISLDPDNLVKESNEQNNIAYNILRPESAYDFEILSSGISASPNPANIFDDVRITSRITNKGTINAYNVQIKYYIDEGGVPFDIAVSTVGIPANSTITDEITWKASKAGENLSLTVLVDPFNSFPELSKANNKASRALAVIQLTAPNLVVSHENIVMTPSPALQGGAVHISALVRNEGFSPASSITVNFYKGVPGVDGVLLGSQTIPSLDPGQNSSVAIDWAHISESGERIIYVRIDPDNQIAEIKEDDNDAFTTLKILSLPDLFTSTGSIVFTPSAPREGDLVQINVTVQNKGEQGATNVIVRAYEGIALIGSGVIPSIPGNSFGSIPFSYDTAGKKGPHEIRVVVDPDNAILEQSKENNTASRTLGVQDADLWLTEQYISPNGDGVKDSTQFFFRLASSQTVSTAIVNERGESVRTYGGPEFENTTAGNITWDGLNDDGVVVADGTYQVRIVDPNGSVLGRLTVIVDNNRSPLGEAAKLGYLLDAILIPHWPGYYFYGSPISWSPDDSGFIFAYALYAATAGGDITRIDAPQGELSPDGEKVAYSLKKWNSATSKYESEVWVVNRDGSNRKRIDFFTGDYVDIIFLRWSPDSTYISYRMGDGGVTCHVQDGWWVCEWVWYQCDLWIIKPDGTGRRRLDAVSSLQQYEWSSDSSRIVYWYLDKNWTTGSQVFHVAVSNTSGDKIDLIEFPFRTDCNCPQANLKWLSPERVLADIVTGPYIHELVVLDATGGGQHLTIFQPSDEVTVQRLEVIGNDRVLAHYFKYGLGSGNILQLLDATGKGEHLMISDSAGYSPEISISADRESFAYNSGGSLSIYAGGNLYRRDLVRGSVIGGITWSPNGKILAFSEGSGECVEWVQGEDGPECVKYGGTSSLILYDHGTQRETALPVSPPLHPLEIGTFAKWLSDGISILSYTGYSWPDWSSNISTINSQTGEMAPIASGAPDSSGILSPKETFITYWKKTGAGYDEYEYHGLRSLLNLTAVLTVTRDRDAILLKGTAQDLNFEGWKLEYADVKTPTLWSLIAPPSDVPVVNDVFATWIPPYEGRFYVRLTVWDKAGNAGTDTKRVSWGQFSNVTNLYTSLDLFSPNGDGIKDTVELHYTVLEPVNLDFYIYDEKNNVVRTFSRSHPTPGEGSILWDGKNEQGAIVPDGKYRFAVYDYAFHVEVDNTPPGVNLTVGQLKQVGSESAGYSIVVDLTGYAVDDHLKSWMVEYGEGNNPGQWYEWKRGTSLLVKKDDKGNPLLNPVQDDLIDRFAGDNIERYLVRNRLRMTADDFAGGKSTQIADLLSQEIVFHRWDGEGFDVQQGFLKNTYGPTTVGVRETIREQIAQMTVQYSSNGGSTWHDAQSIAYPISGYVEIEWDPSGRGLSDSPYKVRVRAVDVDGNEYASNAAMTNAFTIGVSCLGLTAFNAIETLTILKFQIRSDQDPAYGAWTDIRIYNASEGVIPTGRFTPILNLGFVKTGVNYTMKMVGTGPQGKSYESNLAVYPASLCPEFEIDVEYAESQSCNVGAPGKATLIAKIRGMEGADVIRRTLTYSIQHPNEDFTVLKTLDLTDLSKVDITHSLFHIEVAATIDINSLAEGRYPIKGVLDIETLREQLKAEASGELVVDRTLPTSRITYPGESLLVCPVKVPGSQGDKFAVPIEGAAEDNNQVKRFELYQGDTKTPLTGKSSVTGRLGFWDVTGLSGGTFALTLTVMDVSGNLSCHTTSFSLDNAADIAGLTSNRSIFSPDGDGILDDVTITYLITEYAQVDVRVYKANKTASGAYTLDTAVLRTIVPGSPHFGGSGNATWDGKNDSGSVVPDGKYGIAVSATDSCENTTQRWIVVGVANTTIDATRPDVALYTPKEGELYGLSKSTVAITGSIIEENLDQYVLRFGAGENPASWTTLLTGTTLPPPSPLFTWNVAKGSGIPDGLYTISLYAKDKSKLEGEARVRITLDNTPPEVSVTLPVQGGYVTGTTDIRGTAADPNLDHYTLEFSEGECAGAFKWATIRNNTTQVFNGILATWKSLPADGNYCLRLSAIDKLGNKAETKVNIKTDTHPPAAPALTGRIENGTDASLSWTRNAEADLRGYNLYRENQKLTSEPITDVNYLDRNLKGGNYSYTVRAVDFAGLESIPSNAVKIKIDLTPPDAKIALPGDGAAVSGRVDIKGTAYSLDDFKQYRVYAGQGSSPSLWNLIRTSPLSVTYGILAGWDTLGLLEGIHSIKLEAEDLAGNINAVQIAITVDNTPPSAPVLLSAVPSSTDVTVTWIANAEPDLSGYLLYRNDQLANASGITVGDLKGYLLTGTTYLDKALPDGRFRYYLVAMDRAGNLSNPSNVIEVSIDTKAPKATIAEPTNGSKFGDKTLVRADSPDFDIASIRFQYKRTTSTTWINLGSPVTKKPYVTYIDPQGLGLTYGDYHLRAVATDKGGKSDSSPASITVTYTDLTPPAPPSDLNALTNGRDVTLTWTANTEPDLGGYNIYRTSAGVKTKVNPTPVVPATYQDSNLPDGLYTYSVTAVDSYGNESVPSNSASAKVYAPVLSQPLTPTGQKVISIHGSNAEPNSTVEISIETDSDPVPPITVPSDSTGRFFFDVNLTPGENRIRAKATDGAGNVSRNSDTVVVVYNEPPSAPTGLSASVEGSNVNLTWNPNPETDLAGYNVYRNGQKVNPSGTITSGDTSASSFYYDNPPSNAFDGDPSTYWMSDYSSPAFTPVWWEIDLYSPELINHVEIDWGSLIDGQGNETPIGAKDFEVQTWSGYVWVPLASITGNGTKRNTFDFKPSYRTDKIRIYITATTDTSGSNYVGMSEIKILKDNLVTETSFDDLSVPNGTYAYTVTAMDLIGSESPPSNEASADVHIAPPESPINLKVNSLPEGKTLQSVWEYGGAPVAGYNLYRGTTSGGPYVKENTALITEKSYMDAGLTNGVAYFYVVVSVDSLGNESAYSNEAMGMPADSIVPAKPVIFFPTIPEAPLTVYDSRTDITGIAEPASTIELFKNGLSVGTTTASETDLIENFTLAGDLNGASISGDGRMFAYAVYDPEDSSYSIWLKRLATEGTTLLIEGSYSPVWSPDGKSFAYSSNNGLLYLYDVETGSTAPLTGDVGVYEMSPSWSSDGRKIAFSSNRGGFQDVWMRDLGSGAVTQITSGKNTWVTRLSPGGKKVAYFQSTGLYVVDLLTTDVLSVDTQTDGASMDWSPDSRKLAFVSNRNGSYDLFAFDLETQTSVQVTDSPEQESSPSWSPDGQSLLFARREVDWSSSIRMVSPPSTEGHETQLQGNLSNLIYLAWIKSGGICSINQGNLSVTLMKGLYRFSDVPLDAGENGFYVRAFDSSGNGSEPSDEISLLFDTSLTPDLEVSSDEIFIYPPYPIPGEPVVMSVGVLNRSRVEIRGVEVDIYLGKPSGTLELLKSATISSIAPDSTEAIQLLWDSSASLGQHTLIAVVDPRDKILELWETNNLASKEFIVVEQEGVSVTGALDSDQYRSHQNANIRIKLINSGFDREIVLETWIEDGEGYAVTLLNTASLSLPYASDQNLNLLWNTGSTYAGPYRVHALVKSGFSVIAEHLVPFTILPDIEVLSTLVTDKTRYGTKEDMMVSFKVENRGTNWILPDLKVKVRILDSSENELFVDNKTIANLLPGADSTFRLTWSTGLNPPGDYRAMLEVSLDAKIISSGSASFKIDADSIVTGGINVSPSVVILGNPVAVAYTVHNKGNVDLNGFNLQVIVTDPETFVIMNSHDETIDLPMNGSRSSQVAFSTQEYGLKAYSVVLKGNSKTIASASFTVRDGTPPVVSILSPRPNSYVSANVVITCLASDDASGVDSTEYQIDARGWNPLPVSDVLFGRYAAVWTPGDSDTGLHLIRFRATDKAGNTSAPVETKVTVVTSLPPVANAGGDQNVSTGQVVTLDGSGSYDPGGAPITFRWGFVEVPQRSTITDASLSDRDSSKPTFAPDKGGTYWLQLIVNDGIFDSKPDFVAILASTPGVPPNANAGPDQNVATGVEASLDGSESYDTDGQPLTFQWTLESKPSGSALTETDIEGKTTPNPSFTPDVDGVYRFRLVVNDGYTDSAPDSVEIHAFPATGNIAPNARAGKDQHAKVNTLVVLDGSASYDPDDGPADMLTFLWSFKEVPPGSALLDKDLLDRDQVSASFVPDVAGTYTVELQVYDGLDTDTDEVTIEAYSANVPPNARAGQDRKVGPGEEVILDGTMSFDPEESPEPLTYEWRFVFLPPGSALTNGNIVNATTATPKFTPDVVGTYVVELTVSDGLDTDFDHVMVIATTEPWVEVTPNEGTLGTEFTLKGHHYEFGFSKGKLYMGKKTLKAVSWASESILIRVKKANPPAMYDIKVLPKKPKGGTQQIIWERGCFTVKVPEVYRMTFISAAEGYRVTGKFFGTKKGKIYLGDLACKVKTWSMNPATNESEATFLLPKGVTTGIFMLNVVNKVGRGKKEVSVP